MHHATVVRYQGWHAMMKRCHLSEIALVVSILFGLNAWAEMPKITGKPVIDTPQLLEWPADSMRAEPILSRV